MNPPSHLIINAALRKWNNQRNQRPFSIPRGPFLLGAVLPDLPLTLLWIGAYCYVRFVLGDSSVRMMDSDFDTLYFTNPFWIASYNTLHSPTLLLIALGLLWRFHDLPDSRGHRWFWLLAGCLMHSMLDIPTHANDGPLLFFPFEWSIRFHSPISYWDPRYHGRTVALFELTLDLILLGYLFGPRIAAWIQRRRTKAAEPSA
ncbi:MAG: hypothetical protein Fur005_43240 [Roseiflexaceae bacterium]